MFLQHLCIYLFISRIQKLMMDYHMGNFYLLLELFHKIVKVDKNYLYM